MPIALDDFTRAYIEAALFTSTDDTDDSLDKYGIEDIAPSTLEAIVRDCKQFQQENAEALEEKGDVQGGHDFWLTRNGHGAGFWDGDWPVNGKALTLASKKYGEADLYVGDDGYIYQMGTETPGPVPPREEYNPTSEELAELKAMGIQGSMQMGIIANVKSGLLRKKEPKMAFDFSQQSQRQYDYEANGNDVVLISPANTTKLLEADEARNFWLGLDHIEDQTVEGSPQGEYDQQVQTLIRSYFDKEAKAASSVKYVVKVDASGLRKGASAAYIASVVTATDGDSVEKLKFTTKKDKAATFTQEAATKLKEQLVEFRLGGSVVRG